MRIDMHRDMRFGHVPGHRTESSCQGRHHECQRGCTRVSGKPQASRRRCRRTANGRAENGADLEPMFGASRDHKASKRRVDVKALWRRWQSRFEADRSEKRMLMRVGMGIDKAWVCRRLFGKCTTCRWRALADAVILSTGTSVPKQWTRLRPWPI